MISDFTAKVAVLGLINVAAQRPEKKRKLADAGNIATCGQCVQLISCIEAFSNECANCAD